MSIQKKTMIKITGVVLSLILLAGIGSIVSQQKKSQSLVLPPPVKADTRVLAEGVVMPVKASALNFSMSGLVSELLVVEGDKVKSGQLLAKLSDQEIQAQYQRAQADLAKTRANLVQMRVGSRSQEIDQRQAEVHSSQAALELASVDYDRMSRLFTKGLISQQDFDQSTAKFRSAQADIAGVQAKLGLAQEGSRQESIDMAQAEVAAALASVQQYESQLSHTELKAPFDGTVMFINFNVGEYVVTGSTNMVDAGISANTTVQLGDLSRWRVKTEDLTELDIVRVKNGAPATVTFDGIPGLTLMGKVVNTRAFGEKRRGDMTYTVTIDLDQADERLRWNMRAKVAIDCE